MKKVTVIILALVLIATGIYIYNERTDAINNGKTETTESENKDFNEENEKLNDIEKNEANNTVSNTEKETQASDMRILKEISPSGFMGSSLYKVTLYSNGETYILTYDGNGNEDKNIVSKDLIAKDVKSLEMDESEENAGGIIVTGGEILNDSFGWVKFLK